MNPQNESEILDEENQKEIPEHTPPIAREKVARFGPWAFQSGSKFGKGATNFNPPNKQRPGRAAGRGR